MSGSIRIFVAVDLPGPVRSALGEITHRLSLARIHGIRLVQPEAIHLTLKFLGDVPRGQVEHIVDAVSKTAITHATFSLELANVGAFPNRQGARVLWLGVTGELERFHALRHDVEVSLEALGFDRDRKRFRPHLTVARIRDTVSRSDRRRAMRVLFSAITNTGLSLMVESISLVRSTLTPNGSTYDYLASAPFKNRSVMESTSRSC